jgi:ATP-binding cassette subfamily A (ABC1) protein 3
MSCGTEQLLASMERILTEKRRNISGTLCEYLSHFIILGILILGYYQATVTFFPPADYSTINLSITEASTPFEIYTNLVNGPIITPNLNLYLQLGEILSNAATSVRSIAIQTAYGRSFTNLLYAGDLHFAPNNDLTHNLISYLNRTYSQIQNVPIYVHDSEKDGVNFILNHLDSSALAFIVLRDISHNKINYVIRQNYTTLPNTNEIIIAPAIGLQTTYQQYLLSGFLSIQRAVDDWIFHYTNVSQVNDPVCTSSVPNFAYTPYPTYSYDQNLFYSAVGFLMGLAMVMSTMYPVSKLTKSIVEEKETRMRELMKIMGLHNWVYTMSWFLNGFILFFFIAVTATWLTTSSFLVSSNSFLIFLFFFFFCMSEINFAFLISVFFSNSKLAAIFGPVILFSTILPRYIFYTTNGNEFVGYKILACILSPTAFAFGADIISNYEYGGIGVQFSNISNGSFNFGTVLIMLWLDFYIYAFLAWYLDRIIPHEMGTHYSPFFIVSPKYWYSSFIWMFSSSSGQLNEEQLAFFNDMPEFSEEACLENPGLEFVPPELRPFAKIRIKDLGKRYDDGKVAVHNLSLAMLEGQITCLLGHNGAGENTFIFFYFYYFILILSPW